MVRNVIAVIFLLALALPAAATPAHQTASEMQDCHGMPMEHSKGAPSDSGMMQQHGCIGCIAPYAPAISVSQFEPLPFIAVAEIIRTMYGSATPPSTPPPRS